MQDKQEAEINAEKEIKCESSSDTSDLDDRVPENATQTPEKPLPPQEKKKSPADAFLDLKDVINVMRSEMIELKKYSMGLLELTELEKRKHFEAGHIDGIRSLCRIHQLLFRQLSQIKTLKEIKLPFYMRSPLSLLKRPNGDALFLCKFNENIESELSNLGIEIVYPAIGSLPDYRIMTVLGNTASSLILGHKERTIAEIKSCGYVLKLDGLQQVISKSEVIVYASSTEVKQNG